VASHLDDYSDTFTYDLVGNRLLYIRDSDNNAKDKTLTYRYDANDRLVWEKTDLGSNGIDTTTFYTYDNPLTAAAGDATQLTRTATYAGDNEAGSGSPASDTTYQYNVQGRTRSVAIDANGPAPAGITANEYRYSDQGARVAEFSTHPVLGQLPPTLYLVDANNPTGYSQVLEMKDTSGALQRSNTLGLDLVAHDSGSIWVRYLLYDGHGSTRQLLDDNGQIVVNGTFKQVFTYDAYGNLVDGNPERCH